MVTYYKYPKLVLAYMLDSMQCQQLLYVNLTVIKRAPQFYAQWNPCLPKSLFQKLFLNWTSSTARFKINNLATLLNQTLNKFSLLV